MVSSDPRRSCLFPRAILLVGIWLFMGLVLSWIGNGFLSFFEQDIFFGLHLNFLQGSGWAFGNELLKGLGRKPIEQSENCCLALQPTAFWHGILWENLRATLLDVGIFLAGWKLVLAWISRLWNMLGSVTRDWRIYWWISGGGSWTWVLLSSV